MPFVRPYEYTMPWPGTSFHTKFDETIMAQVVFLCALWQQFDEHISIVSMANMRAIEAALRHMGANDRDIDQGRNLRGIRMVEGDLHCELCNKWVSAVSHIQSQCHKNKVWQSDHQDILDAGANHGNQPVHRADQDRALQERAFNEGHEKGKEKGFQKGFQKGLQKGSQKGSQNGKGSKQHDFGFEVIALPPGMDNADA